MNVEIRCATCRQGLVYTIQALNDDYILMDIYTCEGCLKDKYDEGICKLSE